MRRCHPASGARPALNLRCFVASRFPLLRPAESQPPFQGNLSEGSVLFIEFLLFYHLRRLERKHVFANMASTEQISQFWTDPRPPGSNRRKRCFKPSSATSLPTQEFHEQTIEENLYT